MAVFLHRQPDTGEVDKDIFSPDCFHPNRKGHELLTYILWNTMIRYPVGMKPTQYPIYKELADQELFYACPTQVGFTASDTFHQCTSMHGRTLKFTVNCLRLQKYPYLWTYTNSQNLTETDFNFTTTTSAPTRTTTTTTVPTTAPENDEDTLWIVLGCVIGGVGILVVIASVWLCCRAQREDEQSFL